MTPLGKAQGDTLATLKQGHLTTRPSSQLGFFFFGGGGGGGGTSDYLHTTCLSSRDVFNSATTAQELATPQIVAIGSDVR